MIQEQMISFIEFFKPKSYGMGQYISIYPANKESWSSKYASCTYEIIADGEYFNYEELQDDFMKKISSHFGCVLEIRESGRKTCRISYGRMACEGILRLDTKEIEIMEKKL